MHLIKDIELSQYMDEPPAEHRVEPASSWVKDVIDDFYRIDDTPRVRLGWRKTQADFYFRPGEVTLWAGINGHGKSQVVGQAVLDLMVQNERVCMASLEMAPKRIMGRMARQANGSSLPPKSFIEQFGRWTDGRLWLYDHVGSSDPRTILAVIRYALDKFQITHFVVDNLMKVVAGEDNYNGQKDFVNGLCQIANSTGVHIHLVLHTKKARDEYGVPGKFDIKGSGAITDLVDNVFVVWRNKEKEKLMREGDQKMASDPDMLLLLEKQRNGEAEGKYQFWFDPQSFQYMESRHDLPKLYSVETGISVEEVEF